MTEKDDHSTDNPTKSSLSNVKESEKVSSDQSTLLLNDDYWKKISLFFRSEVSLMLQQHEQEYHQRTYSGTTKFGKDKRRPRKDWRLLCSIAVKIIDRDGYLYAGNLKEERKLAIEIPSSQQFSYLIKNLLIRYPDLVTFHLDCNNWKIVCYTDEKDRIKNMLEKRYKKAKKPKHWV